ncbi:hypothetical protein AUL54_05100 [Bacillus sp. SDLI1]|nr:hypothetical protein AUL54_05100 [Bacillus sp. SDLI1]
MQKRSEDASLGAFSVSGEFFIHDHMGGRCRVFKGAAGAFPAELFIISLYVTSNVLPAFCVRYSSSAAMPRSTSCLIAYVSSAVIKSRLSHQAAS